VLEGRIDLEHMQGLDDFTERLCSLPGIGPWTAHYIAMRCLHHPDAFPAGDLVLRKQMGVDTALSAAGAELRAAGWRPWRAYALIHLWARASDAETARLQPPPAHPPRRRRSNA
jgi:AraC family transcriptional regulator of adaptative response / DNA-3-methyladenine glycosylase II